MKRHSSTMGKGDCDEVSPINFVMVTGCDQDGKRFFGSHRQRNFDVGFQHAIRAMKRKYRKMSLASRAILTMALLLNFDQCEADYTDSIARWCTITMTIVKIALLL
uniref:Uncharacterized protein n=1 Tax=Strigamia maritima TaxID=126957 RepID=T1JJP6_STRMM